MCKFCGLDLVVNPIFNPENDLGPVINLKIVIITKFQTPSS
jgi:hypothetical protein